MAIQIHGTIKPKNKGSFPVAEAADILMPDGSRLNNFSGIVGTALSTISQRVTDLENQEGEGGGSGEGGVSSWNDLEDKPFSEELGMVALFDEQEVTGFQIHSVYQLPFKAFTPSPFLLIPGETYQVRWNDTVWNCTAIDGNTTIPGAVGIGNGYLFGQPDTGEPFAIVTFATTNELGICPLDGSETVNVGIFQEGMVVTPLDAKYLPMEAIDARIEEIINAALEGDY